MRLLRREVEARWRAGLLKEPVRIPPSPPSRDFDDLYTAPEGGFRDKADYYERCSSGPHLASIRLPAVILSADDDPIATGLGHPEFPAVFLRVPSLRPLRPARGLPQPGSARRALAGGSPGALR